MRRVFLVVLLAGGVGPFSAPAAPSASSAPAAFADPALSGTRQETSLFPEAPALRREAAVIGRPSWRPMLEYLVALHERATHPASPPFASAWEELGPGYGYGPAFGHWDVVHEIIDVMPTAPQHAEQQLMNDVRLQLPNGYLPGSIYMPGAPGSKNGKATYDEKGQSHPPLWVVAADDWLNQTGRRDHLREFFTAVTRQIGWFETARRAEPEGFFYTDIRDHKWESGVDEGVRFDHAAMGPKACIDATCHVYQLCAFAAKWAHLLGEDAAPWQQRADRLRTFITTQLWDERTGYFYDVWAVSDPQQQTGAYEGLWPLIVGAAEPRQAQRVIDEWVLNPKHFFTPHPISTVAADDPKFELRMWRGPTWNSMTYWVARGCVRYQRPDAAAQLLERALDDSAAQFVRTGTIWEYYHPFGGAPETLARKPQTKRNQPWTDYLGHNPLLAMTRLWAQCAAPTCPSPAVTRPVR